MSLPPSFGSSTRSGIPPLEVLLLRSGIPESRHRVHAVVCDARGRVLMRAGDPQQLSFIRSAHKPFQASVFVASGCADQVDSGERGLAIACASHAGTAMHAREAFRLLWAADLEAELLQCPVPAGCSSPLEHNCSGKHAAFLASCRHLGWSTESYLQPEHPLQREVLKRFALGEFKLIRAHLVPYYRNVYDGLFHIGDLSQGYMDALTGILQIYLNLSANKTSEIVKILTIITIITTPLMIVGTWYGMNFENMPEVKWQHGYAFAFGLTLVTTALTLIYFRKKRWL
jgi:Mg2+ and Co2+ transporter CorA